MSTTPDTRYDDATLQAAIDGALTSSSTATFSTFSASLHWFEQAPARLALAKALLARLPEPDNAEIDAFRSFYGQASLILHGIDGGGDNGTTAEFLERLAFIPGFQTTPEEPTPTPALAPPPRPWQPAVGDVVRLKSGGPAMTIMRPAKGYDGEAIEGELTCMWTEEGDSHTIHAAPACLTPAEEAQP
jgi:uncharacterized protein YodC (DUF2158 family)